MEAATTRGRSWALLQHLTDCIGPRLSGSAGAAEAVRWTAKRLRADGLDARLEPVLVPHWVRGVETAELSGALPRRLVVTALGGSVPTPAEGITAEVIVADGLEGLRALDAARVKGRIVLFNRAMVAGSAFQGYGKTTDQRTKGASEAARRGAVASIVRSVGTLDARLDAPRIASALAPLGATRITAGGGGADISEMRPARVPLMGLDVDGTPYFDWHHTPADTLDKVNPGDLARSTAALTAMAYMLVEMPQTLPRPVPSPSPSPSRAAR